MTTSPLLDIGEPAFASLSPGRLPWQPAPERTVADLATALGLERVQGRVEMAASRFVRLRPPEGPGLFVKILPPSLLGPQLAADRIARHWAGADVAVCLLEPGFPRTAIFNGMKAAFLAYPLLDIRPANGSDTELEALGAALALLHRTAARPSPLTAEIRGAGLRYLDDLRSVAGKVRDGRLRAPLEPRAVAAAITPVGDGIDLTNAQPIHGDANPGNLVFAGSRVVFLDFETAPYSWLPPLADIAFALERFVAVPQGPDGKQLLHGAARLLAGYRTQAALSWQPGALARMLRFLSAKALCTLMARAAEGCPTPTEEWRKFLYLSAFWAERADLLARLEETHAN
ncbi:phosphotransferase [Niveispirillum fermenti]|uniref:phosphotransferase n=1 Tax=Niveispirillum fermenti TaxID=1233113 RepID=UPI003A8B9FCE